MPAGRWKLDAELGARSSSGRKLGSWHEDSQAVGEVHVGGRGVLEGGAVVGVIG